MGGDSALVLDEAEKAPAGPHRIRAEPLDHGVVDELLQAAAMDRELRRP